MIPMNLRQKIILFLATGGYLGHMPIAPGTFGSLPGLLICLAMSEVTLGYAIFLVLVLIGVAIGIAQQAEKIIKSGEADVVMLARELLRNPYWPQQAAQILGATFPPPLQYERAY